MQIRRTPRQTVFAGGTALMVGGLAAWNIRDGLQTGSTALLVLGGVFAGWAVYLLLDLARRGVPVEVGADGLTIRHAVRSVHIPFDRMTWARIGGPRRASIIAWRPPGADRDSYTAFAHRTVGPDGVDKMRAAISAARPNLPGQPPGAATDRGEA
jgi:hypothetical protein